MKDDIINVINNIINTYKGDEYIIDKFQNYMINHLPSQVLHWKEDQQQRISRTKNLADGLDSFVESFIRRHMYFYNHQNEYYFSYNGREFNHTTEDSITQKISFFIETEYPLLTQWSKRTKMTVLKKIKDKSLVCAIPESDTIQLVLKLLHPSLFVKRNEAKYFLCVLGDNILKKYNIANQQTTTQFHFIDSKAKELLRVLEYHAIYYLSNGCMASIKHKHHEHSYELSRIISILPCVQQRDNWWWKDINNHALDILCVACHYSNRYGSSDKFLDTLQSETCIRNRIMFLKDKTPETVVCMFYNEYLLSIENKNHVTSNIKQDNNCITWKDTTFLWKQFLESNQLPNIMFLQTLKQELIEHINTRICTQGNSCYFNEINDTFIGVTSKLMPNLQCFLSFWQGTMIEDETEHFLEIEEIGHLYKDWCKSNGNQEIQIERLKELIRFYYPNTDWHEDKYIHGYKNKLWNKKTDILIALDMLKDSLTAQYNINVYDAYEHYCKYHNRVKPTALLVSKVYFEHIWDTI